MLKLFCLLGYLGLITGSATTPKIIASTALSVRILNSGYIF